MRSALFLCILMSTIPVTIRGSAPPAAAHDVEIVGVDYAFRAPVTIAAGPTTFHFRNDGTVPHEFNISLLRRGATVQQFIAALATDTQDHFREASVGVLFAAPGRRSSTGLSTDLQPGRTYMIICIDQNTPGAKKHFEMGMLSVLTVGPRAGPVSPASRAHVDTIIGSNYAFRYPRTLAAGRHRFAFVNEGTVRHEVLMLLLRKGVTLQRFLHVDISGGNVYPLMDDAVGVLQSAPGTTPPGELDVDMLPGREYSIICTDANDARSPPHFTLGMQGAIRVTARPRQDVASDGRTQ